MLLALQKTKGTQGKQHFSYSRDLLFLLFLDTFWYQGILSFLLFLGAFHIQGIWSFLLFQDTFRIQRILLFLVFYLNKNFSKRSKSKVVLSLLSSIGQIYVTIFQKYCTRRSVQLFLCQGEEQQRKRRNWVFLQLDETQMVCNCVMKRV